MNVSTVYTFCPNISSRANNQLNIVFAVLAGIPACLIIALTIAGNLLVLFFKARLGRRQTTLLIWNLGLADFMVGIFVLPMGLVYLIGRKWLFGRIMCRLWVCGDIIFCTASIATICIISVDRYLAVTRPLRYKSLVTKTKVKSAMACVWALSCSILLATVKWEQSSCIDPYVCFAGNEIRYLTHSVVFAFFLPAAVTLTLYWKIYQLAKNRQRAIENGFIMIFGRNMNFLTNTLSSNTPLRVHCGGQNAEGVVQHQRRVLRTHQRIAKTLGLVSCAFLFCWLPFFGLYLANSQCNGCIPAIILDTTTWLGYCNSMINPIIYAFTVKEFKKSAMQLGDPLLRLLSRCFPSIIQSPRHEKSLLQRAMNAPGLRRTRVRSLELMHPKKGPKTIRKGKTSAARTSTGGDRTALLSNGMTLIDSVAEEPEPSQGQRVKDQMNNRGEDNPVIETITNDDPMADSMTQSLYSVRLYCMSQETEL